MQGIIHHMIDIKNPDETFSVSEFQKEVRHYIDTIDMPIVVGGTGLYIKGALYDYTFEETESKHDEIKAKSMPIIQMKNYISIWRPLTLNQH